MATQTTKFQQAVQSSVETTSISVADRAVGAAMIASGVGSLVLGIAIVAAEANAGIKSFLAWNSGVGPLSGKTGVSVIAFIISWVALHFFFQRKAVSLTTSFIITVVLVVLGLLLSYPPVFQAFAG
ncbi:MAG: hypothetical protein IPK17_13245 [Chloroflexi bacterium]|uniref:hypothetical protein n=1 Tax=Candidatus Flexifilum breve TaxID=3140694 RepID=UPI0031370558|nr:hypothetical protein [Chloroflexota bacterium]